MRYENEMDIVHHDLDNKVDKIIFTSRKAKEEVLANMGIWPNIWIDDNPRWIFQDAK